VKEHVREKLARYQREAARVLADHFFRREPEPSAGFTVAQIAQIVEIAATVLARLNPPRPSPQPLPPRPPVATLANTREAIAALIRGKMGVDPEAIMVILSTTNVVQALGHLCPYGSDRPAVEQWLLYTRVPSLTVYQGDDHPHWQWRGSRATLHAPFAVFPNTHWD
jgi:hypothetical protein